ncbi:hypothetical protein [Sorangium sp. So ce131]|uniref:hypothetical protein n=1 Tax=Sorangium sp. So ce131 TaxID=3133282 RepID=UPI003F5DBB48
MSDRLVAGPYREPLERSREEDEARFVVEPELAPGERLLWAGRPVQGPRFTMKDVLFFFVCMAWLGCVVLVAPRGPSWFLLFALAVGLYNIVGLFFWDMVQRARTFYGLTDRRALLVEGRGRPRVTSLELDGSCPIHLQEGRQGRGTIRFGGSGATSWWSSPESSWPPDRKDQVPSFRGIRDARKVYERLCEVQRERTAGELGVGSSPPSSAPTR